MTSTRKRIAIWLIAAVMTSLCMIPVSTHAASGSVYMQVTQDNAGAQKILKLVNAERSKRGLKAVKLDTNLTNSAIARAAEVSVFIPKTSPHKRPNGKLVKTINSRISYECALEAEGLTPKQIVQLWMRSPAHKKGVLLSSAKSVGISYTTTVEGYQICTLEFSSSSAKTILKSTAKKSCQKKVPAKSSLLKKSCFKMRNVPSTMTAGKKKTGQVYYENKSTTYGPGLVGAKSIKWSSSNKKIATVTKKGVIKAIKPGTVTIKAKVTAGSTYTLKKKITVKKPVLLEDTILKNRQTLLDYAVENGTEKTNSTGDTYYETQVYRFNFGPINNEYYLIVFPDSNEVRLCRYNSVIRNGVVVDDDGETESTYYKKTTSYSYILLYTDQLDDPLYFFTIDATEKVNGVESAPLASEHFTAYANIDRKTFNGTATTANVNYHSFEVDEGEDEPDQDACYQTANDFLTDTAPKWNSIGEWTGISGLNMFTLGFPEMYTP